MNIAFWDVADAGELVHVYNEQIASVPHCFPVSPKEFEEGLRDPKNDRHCKEMHSEKIIVGEQGDRVIGFAHVLPSCYL